MKILQIGLADRSYPIYIGSHLLKSPFWIKHLAGNQVFVVTDENVAPLYLETVLEPLREAGKAVSEAVIPAGEVAKTLAQAEKLWGLLLERRSSRNATLIALGGGVVGDLVGFVAACYQRGVPFLQIPTTLLAQVDSSVGGKTAVNHPLGKNMIGAFHQPVAVVADMETLGTLPDRELRAGLAEVIKYGAILDADFFNWLEENLEHLTERDPQALAYAVERSCRNKAYVVEQDEREAGLRAILNFGHTFGHAIEAVTHYERFLHGEAVAIGMVLAADLSHEIGWLDRREVDRLRNLIVRAELPTTLPKDLDVEEILSKMAVDKKNRDGEIRVVLLGKLGKARLPQPVPIGLLRKVLQRGRIS